MPRNATPGARPDLVEFGETVLQPQRRKHRLTQSSLAQQIGVHQSQISRVEKEGQHPEAQDVRRYMAAYRLTPAQCEEWLTLLYGDYIAEIGGYTLILESLREDARFLYDLRMNGQPQLVISLSNLKLQRVASVLQRCKSESIRRELMQIQANILLQQAVAYTETQDKRTMLANVQSTCAQLFAIAKELQSAEIKGWALHRLGTAYYVAGSYAFSKPHLVKSIHYLTEAWELPCDQNQRLWLYRALSLPFAYLGRLVEFQTVAHAARKLLTQEPNLKGELRCTLLEGLARGQALLNCGDPLADLATVDEIFQTLPQRALFRRIQTIRSGLEVVWRTKTKDMPQLEQKANEGIVLAREAGYTRYVAQLSELMAKAYG